jgi:hypothetical protein
LCLRPAPVRSTPRQRPSPLECPWGSGRVACLSVGSRSSSGPALRPRVAQDARLRPAAAHALPAADLPPDNAVRCTPRAPAQGAVLS